MAADSIVAENSELVKVLQKLPDGVVVIGQSGTVVFSNKPGARLVKLKPKKIVGTAFPFPLEEGAMRDFDVEMSLKEVSWGGEPATLVLLSSLKSSGAFQLEWKLESAIERARTAEEELAALRESTAQPEPVAEEAVISAEDLEAERRDYEEKIGELESLLELAESRADQLQHDIVSSDHESDTENQNLRRASEEAELQVRQLEAELQDAQSRIQTYEEQAEVAEERAYSLETEVARLEEEAANFEAKTEANVESKSEELESLKRLLERTQDELENSRAESLAAQDALGQLEAKGGQDQSRLTELQQLNSQLTEQIQVLEARQSESQESEEKLIADLAAMEVVVEELKASRADSNDEAVERIAVLESNLDKLSLEKDSLMTELASKSEELEAQIQLATVATEESEELAELLKSETESSEGQLEEHLAKIEALSGELQTSISETERLREKISTFEGLREDLDSISAEKLELAAQLRVAASVGDEKERLQKELLRLEKQLETSEAMAIKGEKVDKLERKLEGALKRAEEAEERLHEERRLHKELKETSAQKIEALQNSSGNGDSPDPEMERMAFQDELTGLPNRNILHRYLGFMLKQSARYERCTAMLRIDCDNFKTLNDTLGVEHGDALIRLIGERLSAVVRGSDVLGRMGEDEFVILLSELATPQEAATMTAAVIKRIYQILKKPFVVEEQNINIDVSIGVSLYPTDSMNGEQMFEHSGVALLRAKETGRGQAQYFTPELQSSHVSRGQLDKELKAGLEAKQYEVVYQPIFDITNGRAVGVEALMRWHHPERGLLCPDTFLASAEASGLIVLLGTWALQVCLEQAAKWHQQGLGFFVSINLSKRQLMQADLVPTVSGILNETKCPPDRILLEVAERFTGPELPKVRETLVGLVQLGVNLAIDNFGTASSSLMEIRKGPFQVVKIDRSIVRDVGKNEDNSSLVLSALNIAHHMGRRSVAVGVESEEERLWLAKYGCRYAQGNLLAQPMPADQIASFLGRS